MVKLGSVLEKASKPPSDRTKNSIQRDRSDEAAFAMRGY